MLLRDLQPGTDYEVTVSALLGRSVGPATSLTARTGERVGCFLQAGWAGLAGHRGPLTSHVPRADTSVEQTLRPVGCLRPVATGWSGGVRVVCAGGRGGQVG